MVTSKNDCLIKILYFGTTGKHLKCEKCLMTECPHAKNTPAVMTEKTNQK